MKKNISIARIAKNISYFIVPIFLILLIGSIAGIWVMESDVSIKNTKNYYETVLFSDTYLTSVFSKYNKAQYRGETAELVPYSEYNDYYTDMQTNVKMGETVGNIYYYNDNSNFGYLVVDTTHKIAITNVEHTMNTDTIEKIKQELSKNQIYWNYEKGEINTSITNLSLQNMKYKYQYERLEKENIDFMYTTLKDELPYKDDYSLAKMGYEYAVKAKNLAPLSIPASIAILMVLAIVIVHGVGRKGEKEGINLNWFDKWPLEIAFIAGISIFAFGFVSLASFDSRNIGIIYTAIIIGALISYLGAIATFETIVKRIKIHKLFKSTMLYGIGHQIKSLFLERKAITQFTLLYGGFALANMFLYYMMTVSYPREWYMLLTITLWILTFFYMAKKTIDFQKIKQAAKSIYEGNTDIKLTITQKRGVLKELSFYIDNIANGLSHAVDQNMKGERFKTELITNVSHDIKTPLTSIINYVDLLKKEKMPNEKAVEYLMILDNKSQRLKKLTEDLVEASKASSGNLKLNMEKLNVNEIIKQISGEFEDRLKLRNLEELQTLPEEDVYIKADSRYLYRILENMYTNAAKYALEGTRIYVDVIKNQSSVVIQMKNVSKEKLNISADELMQRFVRGDSSRNTEGSGLRTFYYIKFNRNTRRKIPHLFRWRFI